MGFILSGLLGQLILGIGQSLVVWGIGIFLYSFVIPLINSSNQAIWKAKGKPDIQGRVFTVRIFIAWLVMPLAQAIADPLADRVLEPAMIDGGRLVTTFSWLVDSGTGAGIGLIFIFTGNFKSIAGIAGYFFPFIRNAEDILPDHEAVILEGNNKAIDR